MDAARLCTDDTIAAIASAAGGGTSGVLRVSGPAAIEAAEKCFVTATPLGEIKAARAIPAQAILHPSGKQLPGELYVWPGSRSYTRQPTIEFHTLGSPPLLDALLRTICTHDVRLARPGEFTLRAFLAGRLDLAQAEAVLGLIDAGSQRELDIALRQMAGGLSQPLMQLREELLNLLADMEAGLDFSEEDITTATNDDISIRLTEAEGHIAELVQRMRGRTASDREYRIVLVGLPNAGKSSLLNALAEGPHALVSDTAGTTRDYISASIRCGDFACRLIDTAGLESTSSDGSIDDLAQEQRRTQQEEADVRLLCLDASRPLTDTERTWLTTSDDHRLVVATKCDAEIAAALHSASAIRTSATTGLGLDALRSAVAELLTRQLSDESSVVAGTALRCRESLEQASAALRSAHEATTHRLGHEFIAGDLRIVLEHLGEVVGVVYTDDVLDRVFSRFCIGK